jgi:hypothetical protein
MRIHTDEPYLHHREMLVIVNWNEEVRYVTKRKIESIEEK